MGLVENVWPEIEAVPGAPGLVDRAWSIVLEREAPSIADIEGLLGRFGEQGFPRVARMMGRKVVVVIRSAHPSIGDPLEVMTLTSDILRAIDGEWGISEIQGRSGATSLLLGRNSK